MWIKFLASIGLLVSVYALYVSRRAKAEVNYKVWCDITRKVSCTRVLNSRYGKIFGVRNTILGLFFYAIIIVLATYDQIWAIRYLSALAVLISIYLFYVTYTRLRAWCAVCLTAYIINVFLLIVSYG